MNSRLMFTSLAILLVAGSASAATLTVPSTTYPTIPTAVAAAVQGDVIEIKAGTYTQVIHLNAANGITVRGKGKVVLDVSGFSNGINVTNSQQVTIENVEVRGAGVGVLVSGGLLVTLKKVKSVGSLTDGFVTVNGLALWLTQCIARESGDNGFVIGASHSCIRRCDAIDSAGRGFELNGNANVVSQCKAKGATKEGIWIHNASFNCDANVVVDNKVSDIGTIGITATGAGEGNLVRNNTVKNSLAYGIEITLDGSVVTDNRVSNTGNAGFWLAAQRCTFLNNKASNAGAQGFFLHGASDGSTVVGNSVKGAATFGFDLNGSPLTFVKNTAKNCAAGAVIVGPGAFVLAFENGFAVN